MQGLAHYNDSPSPPSHRNGTNTSSRSGIDQPGPSVTPSKRRRTSPRRSETDQTETKAGSSIADHTSYRSSTPVRGTDAGPSEPRNGKGKERATTEQSEENLAHTSQADLPSSELGKEPVAKEEKAAQRSQMDHFAGLSEDEVFRLVTQPMPIEGLEDWGIPPPVDPSLCSPGLGAKVAQFLKLKYNNGQHINTSLVQSSSFHNPHIYAKLVEFVDLSERKSHFPSGGWLTRINIEDEIADYGPASMAAEQKRKQDDVKRGQETGKRCSIAFTAGRSERHYKRGSGDRERKGGDRKRDRDGRMERERERERDRGGANGRYGNTLGLGRDRDGGWDERDMKKEKPRYRYY